MKKRLVTMLMVLCMTLPMFASCGTAPVTNETDTEQAETAEPVTGLQIVKDGVSEYVIVRGENASPSDQTAAEQLQVYLQQITGAELPIVTDTVAAAEKEIIVGKTNRETEGEFVREELNEDGFVIKTTGEKLYIVGTEERGTLFGVFDFLERYLGCRFYTADVEKVPEMKTISLEPIEEDKQIPVFMYRDMGWWDYKISELFCAKRKVYITAGDGKRELNTAYGEYKGWVGGTDNVSRLITPAEYYAEHPEYFALVDGVRMETDAGGGPQLCLSNPEVIQLLTEKVREKLQAGMDKWGMYTVTQMDNNNPCTCDNCIAIYEEEGGAYSGTLLRAVNAVATALKDEYPNIRILTLAYNHTSSAPAKTKPADNVVIMKTVAKCISHDVNAECGNIFTGTPSNLDGTANSFVKDLSDWGKICDQMYIYDYHMNYMDLSCTVPDFHSLYNDVRFYADNGAFGLYTQGNYKARSTEFGELRAYLLTKLTWNPYMTEEEYWGHMDDFLEGVYGPGWTYIKQYIELAEELTEDRCFRGEAEVTEYYPMPSSKPNKKNTYPDTLTMDDFLNYETTDWTQYWNWYDDTEENRITSEGRELFRKAIEMAETDEQRRELDKASVQVEYIYANYLYLKANIRNNMPNMFNQYCKAHPEEAAQLTSDVKTAINEALVGMWNTVWDNYEQYCRTLIEKMMKYTEYYNEYIQLSRYEEYNYGSYPRYWLWPGQ